ITVFRWEILNPQAVYGFGDKLTCEITCSRGTYIRTLIHDLGEILGCGAHMGSLIRLASGDFNLEAAITLTQVEEYSEQGRLDEVLISINKALCHLPSIQVEPHDLPKVMNGGKLSAAKYGISNGDMGIAGTLARVLEPPSQGKDSQGQDSQMIAVAELKDVDTHQYWQPVKVCAHNNES
ncbi:MAG TPA: hypothetical protein VHY08_17910, partial [Bacillota bacterium]|nr:hypothetical protein [Bacillota bacterium]